jgi:PAS domain S-box-containing protein
VIGIGDEQFRGLLETAPDAMIAADDRGRIVLVNSQTEKPFGYAREEVLGKTIEILVPAQSRDAPSGHRGGFLRSRTCGRWERVSQ